ncbi:uncharacterized protein LOC127865301 [Dreissena polymorpha]|uniref:ZP domain-containing protein n=1 Tax=Dreissena polymorpha TaxID=45954 RepID=A0A9D4RPG7_DREPO|nr:uncharacterized protein LOC127865301 [Dreissena polymorpha]KAH3876556.1 hypothetical protein DPMN_000402 [Dreissena polymorpha]
MTNNTILQVFLVVAIVFINGAYGFEKQCFHDDADAPDVFTLVMRAQISTGVAMQIMALNGASNAPTNCKSVQTGSVNELVIKYKTSSVTQTTPNLSTNDCFVSYSAPTFSLKVAVQGIPGFVQITDQLYYVDCNTSMADAGFQSLSGVNIANDKTFYTAVTRNDRVTMQLIKVGLPNAGSVLSSPVLLGQKVRVRVIYYLDPAATNGEYPIGIHNYDLTVGPGSAESGRVKLIKDDGCTLTRTPFDLLTTFAYKPSLSHPRRPNQQVFETGAFNIVMFATPTSKQLHFKVRYSAECYSDDDPKCFDKLAYCEELRKKRATDDEGNTTLSLNIEIAMPGETPIEQDVGSVNHLKAKECVADKTYWILAVLLGIALLIVTMVGMYVFCRLQTEQQRVEMVQEKTGF